MLLFMQMAPHAQALSVAVLPVEDLSQGRNGVNFPLTDFLQQSMTERGLEVIPSDRVITFMARNRIRWLGFLSTSHICQAKQDLGADFVLLGTVSQRQDLPLAALGMVLSLVRTSDARTIWTDVGGVSKADVSNFLAIDEPENIDEILPVLTRQIMNSWPSVIEEAEGSPGMFVETSRLEPMHAKPGDEVRCNVRLRPAIGNDKLSQVLLMVGDDNYLEMRENQANMYSVSWFAPDRDGSLPVSLVLKYGSGGMKVFFVGNYQVDNSAPKLSLKIVGAKVNNITAFNARLPVIPVWQDPEPVSRWSFSIQNLNGEIMAGVEGTGAIPPRFVWKGQRPDGRKAEDGMYEIILKVWDRADNPTVATQKVFLKGNPPTPVINAETDMDSLVVRLDCEDEIPVDFWTLEILYSDGEVLMQSQGNELPADISVPYPSSGEARKLECSASVKDVLGNKVRKKISDLMQLVVPHEEESGAAKQDEWVPEF